MKSFILALLIACTPSYSVQSQESTVGTYTPLTNLTFATGNAARGHLTEYNGRLYGLAGERGPNSDPLCASGANWDGDLHKMYCPGTIFSVTMDGTDLRVEHAFSFLNSLYQNTDGYHPYGSLALSPDGRLWGVTQMGGSCGEIVSGKGVLFSYDPTTGELVNQHNFCGSTGAYYPMGEPTVTLDGSVYGTAKYANTGLNQQTIWRLRNGIWTAVQPNIGWGAYGGLVYKNGVLYGFTTAGGANGRGTYFTVDPETMQATVLDNFEAFEANGWGSDNTSIQAPTVLSDGQIIGIRQFGGVNGTGQLFKLASDIIVLKDFDDMSIYDIPRFSNYTGAMTNGRVAEGADGLIYGTSMYGGEWGTGVIYRVARDGSLFQTLHSFGAQGAPARPYGGLIQASDGALYGITWPLHEIFRYTPPTEVSLCQ